MLATQLHELVNSGVIDEHTVMRLEETLCNHVNGRPCAPAHI